jgi:redox-sensing transcriptional repressor
MASEQVSAATVSRLPVYLRSLVDLASSGAATASSERLAELSGVNPATLRRDLASLGITGTRGVGYDVTYVLYEISRELGLNQDWPVVIAGIGNLGRALARYPGFAERGFPVRALVDADPEVVGQRIGDLTIHHLDHLVDLVARLGITVGVLAVPAVEAQAVADRLVAAGIGSILNFAPAVLSVPERVNVRRVDLATELQILSFYHQRQNAALAGTGVPLSTEST